MTTRNEIKKGDVEEICKIKVCKNGPYLVSSGIPLTSQKICTDIDGNPNEWRIEKKYQLKGNYTLCRFGQSKKKPFCDGTHIKEKFDGTETASYKPIINMVKEIDGPALKLLDAEELCASARFCHRDGGIWSLIQKSDNPDARKIAILESSNCPSGRLVILNKKTGKPIEPKLQKSIILIEDPQIGVSGPIWVLGGIPIESAGGRIYEIRNRVTLCRCGQSSNKPFCDSSHYPE